MRLSESKNEKIGVALSFLVLAESIVGTLFVTNRVLDFIGDYNYGLYSFVNSITTWLTVVSSALVASYLRFTSLEAKENNGDVSRTNTLYLKMLLLLGIGVLAFGFGGVCFLYGFHIEFGGYSWKDSRLIYLLFGVSILNIAISLPATVFPQYINYKRQFVFEKSVHALTTLLTFAAHFLVAYYTRSVVWLASFSVVFTLINLCVNIWYCRTRLNMQFQKAHFLENKRFIRIVALFSSVLVLNSVVDQINSQVDKTLLGFFSTPENVTVYQLGMQFFTYLSVMSVAVSGVFVPQIYEHYTSGDKDAVDALFLKVSRIQAIIVSFVAFGFVACGRDFILWWIGPARINAYYCGAVLMVLNIMPLSIKLSIEVQRAANKHKFRSFLYLAVAIMNIGLSIALIQIMPKEKAIFACLIGTIVSTVVCQWIAMNIYNKKVIALPMQKHWFQMGKQMAFGIVGAILAIIAGRHLLESTSSILLKTAIEGLLYSLVYGILLLLFDRKFIFSFVKKNRI